MLSRRLVCALITVVFAALTLGLPLRAAAANPPVVGPNGLPPVDIDYVYSLLDDTNQSTALSDGKSWEVRYYHRESGLAGDSQMTNPARCNLDATTGKNTLAVGGAPDSSSAPGFEDCWWEFMNAWKNEAISEPGMSAANVQDHFFHLNELDPEPYVSNPKGNFSSQPGPFDVVTLTIPGAVHPEQTVVIGEHPDGASLSSFGSAFDDAQGAAVILGVARDMLNHWISTNTWPARTVQFDLFDGEEEGLYGSFFYQNQMVPVGAIDSNAYVGMLNV
ncbi:MAG: M28 family peptidase, partial [Candidatus Dormibacteraeota bacterium]|nr:M28 family peptidase [Candidatus Dormibacteraeota bacterium]